MNNSVPQFTLSTFIGGETINLTIPTREFARESDWYSYFNKPLVNRYLDQGAYPNTREDQEAFWEAEHRTRLLLVVETKQGVPKGVISLSSINYIKKTAEIALVLDGSIEKKMHPWHSLEAICLVTQHGFRQMGLIRIAAGQHVALSGWQNRMEIAGYRIEGIHRNKFVKGAEIASTVTISCTACDFERLSSLRGGALWDSLDKIKSRASRLPRPSMANMLTNFLEKEGSSYYETVFSL